jgi:hypothetical protein
MVIKSNRMINIAVCRRSEGLDCRGVPEHSNLALRFRCEPGRAGIDGSGTLSGSYGPARRIVLIWRQEDQSVSISIDGDELLDDHRNRIGTFSPDRKRIAPAPNMRFTWERLEEISDLMKQMSEPRFQGGQADAPAPAIEDANRPRIVSDTGNNLFRGTIGPTSKPIGSVERGHVFPVFVPAAGVTFTRDELFQITQLLRQAEAVRP